MMKKIIICLAVFLIVVLVVIYNFPNPKADFKIKQPSIPSNKKVAFITAIFGKYELTCKKFAPQTVPTDFICFANSTNLISYDWLVDPNQYHITHPSKVDNGKYLNSIANNHHSFNIAKYYKQSFQNIPRLKDYDVVIWIDGSIEITNPKTSELILELIDDYPIIGWGHEDRGGSLKQEVDSSMANEKYTNKMWLNQIQPYQNVNDQYSEYLKDGYDEGYWKRLNPMKKNFGVWVTCFVAFNNKKTIVSSFLDFWYLQTLKYTTQDQVSFSYAAQKMTILPYTFPDHKINGDKPHYSTDLYTKIAHGL